MTLIASYVEGRLRAGAAVDRELLQEAITIASHDGVETAEIDELLGALDQNGAELTPALWGELWSALAQHASGPVLAQIATRASESSEEAAAAVARVQLETFSSVAALAARELRDIRWELESAPDNAALQGQYRTALLHTWAEREELLQAASQFTLVELERFAFSLGDGGRFSELLSDSVRLAPNVEMPAQVREALESVPYPSLEGSFDPVDSVAGIQFSTPTQWYPYNGTLYLERAAIERFENADGVHLDGYKLALPGELEFSGSGVVRGNGIDASSGAFRFAGFRANVIERGASVRRSDDADVFVANDVHLERRNGELPEGIESSVARFSLSNVVLPDGTLVVNGTGRASVESQTESPRIGAITLDSGATVASRVFEGQSTVEISLAQGEPALLHMGRADVRDGRIVAAHPNTRLSFHGVEFSTAASGEPSPLPFTFPGAFSLPPMSTVHSVPSDRPISIRGEGISIATAEGLVFLESGTAHFRNGQLDRIEAGSVVRAGEMSFTAQTDLDIILDDETTGETPYLHLDGSAIALGGGAIAQLNSTTTLTTGNSGTVSFSAMDPLVSIEANGPVSVSSGAWTIDTSTGDVTSNTAAPQAASALRFRSPLGEWSIHPGLSTTTATGVVQGLVHFNSPIDDSALRAHDPELFAAIEGAERVLARGDSSPLLAPLAYLIARELRRPVPAHGALDGELLEQLEVLRRRNGLDGEAVIDAPLLALLRRQSAALDGGTTQRRAGVFGGALHHQVEAVLEGHSTLSAGTSGELVRRVQREVALQTGRNVVADGIFGQGTAGGIRAYQELRGLPTSGSVDAATMRALLGEYPEAFEEVPVARERVMVMIATNSEVPDELIRFRELARERGARPVILGGPDSDGPIEQLDSYLWMSHEDEIDLDWIVISGHSGGSSTWGTEGEIAYSDLGETLEDYPRAALKVETLSLLNCYNVTEGRATGLWTQMFPNIRALAGFMFSAPGVNAQNSDEMLLNSGRILLGLEVGETPDRTTAEGLAHAYTRDPVVRHQNASTWVRYRNEETGSTERGMFALTASAEWTLDGYGVHYALDAIDQELRSTYESYFAAQEAEFREPPVEHHSGPLREYLNAVDQVIDRHQQRLSTMSNVWRDYQSHETEQERLAAAAEQRGESYERVPFEAPSGWDDVVYRGQEALLEAAEALDTAQTLRSRILLLIYHENMRGEFAERYAPMIEAYNELIRDNRATLEAEFGSIDTLLFPEGDRLRAMSRGDLRDRIDRLNDVAWALPTPSDEDPRWMGMRGADENDRVRFTTQDFVRRSDAFLNELDPRYTRVEWL